MQPIFGRRTGDHIKLLSATHFRRANFYVTTLTFGRLFSAAYFRRPIFSRSKKDFPGLKSLPCPHISAISDPCRPKYFRDQRGQALSIDINFRFLKKFFHFHFFIFLKNT
jgi:hypothetical protein